MADINVERKGPSIWPWIIGLIVLALLIWGLVEMFGDRAASVVTEPSPDTVVVDSPTVTPITPVPPPSPTSSPMDTTPGMAPGAAPAAPDTGSPAAPG